MEYIIIREIWYPLQEKSDTAKLKYIAFYKFYMNTKLHIELPLIIIANDVFELTLILILLKV